MGWPHSHAPRRHPRRTSRPDPLHRLLLFPRSNLRIRLLRFLVLRKFSLHRHLHERRPRRSPSPHQRRHRRLDSPLRPVEPSPSRSKNRPIHPRTRLAWHACLNSLPRPPHLSRLSTRHPPACAALPHHLFDLIIAQGYLRQGTTGDNQRQANNK
jgi:hypothetical protein